MKIKWPYWTKFVIAGQSEQELVQSSVDAQQRAYCIYSNFRVGAALRFPDGTIITGCNVENSSYGLSICAERTALVKAVSDGREMNFQAVAVTATTKAQMISPCGACRQFIAEFNPDAKVYLHNTTDGQVVITNMKHLLPSCFDLSAEHRADNQ